jgi:hypothetical protein
MGTEGGEFVDTDVSFIFLLNQWFNNTSMSKLTSHTFAAVLALCIKTPDSKEPVEEKQ